MVEDTILSQHFMPDVLLQRILSHLQNDTIFYVLETADGKFKSENGTVILKQLDFSQSSSELQRLTQEVFFGRDLLDISDYQGQQVYKVSFFSTDFSISDQLSCALEGAAKVVRFDNLVPDFPLVAGEITDYAISKGSALCR